ncbi:hypothetical protein GCM10007041_18240 [Butyricimonas faecihominis]|nr:hypothetical protein Bfae18676_31250 [Butyricimonas faecihominis]GGJ29443.1 hypothetical protein GCM10007041_18240 [Butyricimonas faecihominis]
MLSCSNSLKNPSNTTKFALSRNKRFMAQSNRMRLYLDMVFGINSIIQMYEKKWNQSILMKCGDKIIINETM